jgi:hypothetical protein
MRIRRVSHTATLMPNGKVLIVGGNDIDPTSAEVYDPSSGAFTITGSLTTGRTAFTATLLNNGRVLIAGGFDPVRPLPHIALASAELYDPVAGTFSGTGAMTTPRGWHKAVLLDTGKVLIAGGYTTGYFSAELYDPESGAFTPLQASSHHEFDATVTPLPNGDVLFAGGNGELNTVGFNAAELYDPGAITFTPTTNMTTPRFDHTSTLLSDGKVLIADGQISGLSGGGARASAEIYDPVTARFSSTGSMNTARFAQTATLLPEGDVLIVGGLGQTSGVSASAEIYHPAFRAPAPVLLSTVQAGSRQGAILHAGTSRVVSPEYPAGAGEAIEVYCTGLLDGVVIPPQVVIGGVIAEILFFGNAPGFAGLNQINVRVPAAVLPGSAVPVRMTYLNRHSNEVTIGVR